MAKKQQNSARQIKITDIRIDGGTQVREKIDTDAVAEYAEAYNTPNVAMPPLEVVWDGKHYWLWDGFHRWHGISKTKKKTVLCNVRNGSVADARWLALSANKTQHMLRRTNADKKNAVLTALKMKPEMSDGAIAEHCGVSQPFVSVTRRSLKSDLSEPAIRTDKNGRQINTSNIGKNTVNPSTDETSDDDENESDLSSEASPSVTTSDEFNDWRDTKAERDSEGSENEERQVDDAEGTDDISEFSESEDHEPTPTPATGPNFSPPVDEANVILPEKAIPAFRLVSDLHKTGRIIDQVIREVERLGHEIPLQHYQGIITHLKNGKNGLRQARPAHVCPYCKVGKEDCKACHGHGWVTVITFNGAPAETKS